MEITISMYKYLIVIIFAYLGIATSYAQEERTEIRLNFRVNEAEIDTSYRENFAHLSRFISFLQQFRSDSTITISRIEISGAASPEGGYQQNLDLAECRIASIEQYILSHIDIEDSLIYRDNHHIAWDYLIEMVEESDMKYKEAALRIMRETPESVYDRRGHLVDSRMKQLMELRYGQVWNEMYERFFPNMRNACAIIVTWRKEPAPLPTLAVRYAAIDTDIPVSRESVPVAPEVAPETVTSVSVKSNALFVAALVMNIGAEVRVAPRWSIDVIGYWSPYDMFAFDRKIRIFGIQPEVRYWWGDAMKRGHFLGLHAMANAFNAQFNDKYRYQDPNHATWGAGLSYGYAMTLGKKQRWGVEFVAGLGYANITYDQYEGRKNGRFLRSGRYHYVGLTRLGVDFTYRFDITKKKKK